MPRTDPYDLLIVGGGISGAGIARDAAGRGLRVLLVEQGDLASATSSASSKLAHGGLRYLETYDFKLVREALAEREVLLSIAPHLCWPLTFVLPHDPSLRAAWKIRLGLTLYDRLATRSRLPGSRSIRLAQAMPGHPLGSAFDRAFTYADCWLDDARLVVSNAVDARERGTDVRPRCRFLGARPAAAMWQARIEPAGAPVETVNARIIVNAAGPWADDVLASVLSAPAPRRLRLVRGSHIVVGRIHQGPEAFILQNRDGRIVFVLPFEDDFTLIGTTDVEHEDPADVRITERETIYLCEAVNRYLARPVGPSDVVWSYAGVRALLDDRAADPSKVTREYAIELVQEGTSIDAAPVLTVYGGKLTTYRRLAERVLDRLGPLLPGLGPAWTAGEPLPGGDMPNGDIAAYLAGFQSRNPGMAAPLARRLVRTYGTRADRIAHAAGKNEDLGLGLTASELRYLIDVELARTAQDILWRRSKLGLRATSAQRQVIASSIALALRRDDQP